jgi:hypothetical protein
MKKNKAIGLVQGAALRTIILLMISFPALSGLFPEALSFFRQGGPMQPEFNSFTPTANDNITELFSGDLNYSIEVLNIGGFPLKLYYNSDLKMQDEASWVGFGWNISTASINRFVRGIPDDFKGDKIIKEYNIKKNRSYGIRTGTGLETAGIEDSANAGMDVSAGLLYNNYYGFALTQSLDLTFDPLPKRNNNIGSIRLAYDINTQSGMEYIFGVRLSKGLRSFFGSANTNLSISSRSGLKAINTSFHFGASVPTKIARKFSLGAFRTASRSAISVNNYARLPHIAMPFKNSGESYTLKIGSAAAGMLFTYTYLTKYQNQEELTAPVLAYPAYGYLYTDEAHNNTRALLDINREKEGSFIFGISPNLALPVHTYDLYMINCLGIQAQARPYRNGAAFLHDPDMYETGTQVNKGTEIGKGISTHIGMNSGISSTTNFTGCWREMKTELLSQWAEARGKAKNDEALFFKIQGEKSSMNSASYKQMIQNRKALRLIRNSAGIKSNISNIPVLDVRESRNILFSYQNAGRTQKFGFHKKITSYPCNTGRIHFPDNPQQIDFTNENRKKHHIAEICITQADGSRFIFATPVYNNVLQELTFNCSGNPVINGIVALDGENNSVRNKRGSNHYYESVSTGPHASSFLLNAILSSDYVDRTGNGITDDDYGSAVKFNYSRYLKNYAWQSPREGARYQKNKIADDQDDMASYIRGEKEIWYLHSIETKTEIAFFILSEREDVIGIGETSKGMQGPPLLKLDRIELYNRMEYLQHPDECKALKTIRFYYDYTLCPGIVAGKKRGKLTLKKLEIDNQDAHRGSLNPYTFSYSAFNPPYNLNNTDRWGNYYELPSGISNEEFPYSIQNKELIDKYASAWLLNNIRTASGGTISIDYESDDYAFVQNKRAMHFHNICGFYRRSDNKNGKITWVSGANKLYNKLQNYDYIMFDLPDSLIPVCTAEYEKGDPLARELIKKRYLQDCPSLYYKSLVQLKKNKKEYIRGYAKIRDYGPDPTVLHANRAYYKRAFIQVECPDIDDNKDIQKIHPISKAAFQYMRLYLPQMLYPAMETNNSAAEDIFYGLLTLTNEMLASLSALYRNLWLRGMAGTVDLNRTWIKLAAPEFRKYGGGSRVRKILFNDAWGTMTDNLEENMILGKEYLYEKHAKGINKTISSGVASYEPFIGNDENSFVFPVGYVATHSFAPNDYLYLEKPFGESLYPAPSVGYAEVHEIPIVPDKPKQNKNKKAKSIYEFYTARDFPVQVHFSPLDIEDIKNYNVLNPLNSSINEKNYAAQTYSIFLNDMHGKPKAITHLSAHSHIPVSRSTYHYKTKNNNILSNKATVIHPDGKVDTEAWLGLDFDHTYDLRASKFENISTNTEWNLILQGPMISIPFIFYSSHSRSTENYIIAESRVISQYGLLEKVISVNEFGNEEITEYLAYDARSGRNIMTKTYNEFNQPLFHYSIPAYWKYPGMGPASQDWNRTIPDCFDSKAVPDQHKLKNSLLPGTECIIQQTLKNNSHQRYFPNAYWIVEKQDQYILMDIQAKEWEASQIKAPQKTTQTLEILRSGRRNMQDFDIYVASGKDNPIINDQISLNSDQILFAKANDFDDNRKTCCCNMQTKEIRIQDIPILDKIFNINTNEEDTDGDVEEKKILKIRRNADTEREEKENILIPEKQDMYLRGNTEAEEKKSDDQNNTKAISAKDLVIYAYAPCSPIPCQIINPWIAGTKGAWFNKSSFYFFSERSGNIHAEPELDKEGMLMDYAPFWKCIHGVWTENRDKNAEKWIRESEIKIIDPNSNIQEVSNVLNHPTSTIYDPLYQWPLYSASMASYQDIAFEAFENPGSENPNPNNCLPLSHFSIIPRDHEVPEMSIVSDVKHSGNTSLRIIAGAEAKELNRVFPVQQPNRQNTIDNQSNILAEHQCINSFSPSPGLFFCAVWIKETGEEKEGHAFVRIRILDTDSRIIGDFRTAKNNLSVYGWDYHYCEFQIPQNAHKFKISLIARKHTAYFDDLRIQPFHAEMKVNVYDWKKLRISAILGTNNLATFYDYDNEGALIRINQETEKGIFTIQEQRSHSSTIR